MARLHMFCHISEGAYSWTPSDVEGLTCVQVIIAADGEHCLFVATSHISNDIIPWGLNGTMAWASLLINWTHFLIFYLLFWSQVFPFASHCSTLLHTASPCSSLFIQQYEWVPGYRVVGICVYGYCLHSNYNMAEYLPKRSQDGVWLHRSARHKV